MAEEVRPRTDLEKLHDTVFDPKTGLEVRVVKVEERTQILEKINDFWSVVRWPVGILVAALLSQVGSWLIELFRGGTP